MVCDGTPFRLLYRHRPWCVSSPRLCRLWFAGSTASSSSGGRSLRAPLCQPTGQRGGGQEVRLVRRLLRFDVRPCELLALAVAVFVLLPGLRLLGLKSTC